VLVRRSRPLGEQRRLAGAGGRAQKREPRPRRRRQRLQQLGARDTLARDRRMQLRLDQHRPTLNRAFGSV
jgi:hypothetical protein